MIELGPWPYFAEDECAAVAAVLTSGKVNYWTGENCREFEKAFAEAMQCRYAIALSNGTLALEAALVGLDIVPGDEVILPPRTFIATASAVVARGATPVLADVDSESQCLTAETIQAAITPKTKAVIVVHLAGWPADMEAIVKLAKQENIAVIEDCAQAHGAKINGKPVGSFGDIAAFSFCQDKIMTTGGEGGMVLTQNEAYWKKMWSYKDHGKNPDKVFGAKHPDGFRWLHDSFGSNWRLTEMQAAIGRLQLTKLPAWLDTRRANAEIYQECFHNNPHVRCPVPPAQYFHAYYKFYVFLNTSPECGSQDRDAVLQRCAQEGLACFHGSCGEIYREQAFVQAGLAPREALPTAKALGNTSLMLPVHPTMTPEQTRELGQRVNTLIENYFQ